MDGFCVVFVGKCENLDAFGYHEGGVETESEMSDDSGGIIFVFADEFFGSGECYLVGYHPDCRKKSGLSSVL